MKKVITSILAVNLILSAFSLGSYAETETTPAISPAPGMVLIYTTDIISQADISETAEIVAKVKTKLNIPDTLTEFENTKSVSDNSVVYNLTWHDKDYTYSIDAETTQNGDIIYYSKYDMYETNDGYSISLISDDEIKAIVKKWLSDLSVSYINEIDFDNMTVTNNLYDSSVSAYTKRIVNGIEFPDDTLHIYINKNTKEIERFNCSFTYADIPSNSGTVSTEKAEEKYKQKDILTLMYIRDPKNEGKAFPVYGIEDAEIDAKTGEFIGEDDRAYNTAASAKQEFGGESSGGMGRDMAADVLTKDELSKIQDLSGLISEEEAAKKIASLENTNLDKYTITEYNYNKYSDDKYSIYVRMRNGENSEANVRLDAQTGELLSLYIYDDKIYYSSERYNKNVLSEEEAKAIADKFVQKYNTKNSEYIYDSLKSNYVDNNYVVYVRTVNGIPYYEDTINVRVNPESKTIQSYSANYSEKISFENAGNIISKDDAYNALFNEMGVVLNYSNVFNKDTQKYDVKLIYRLNSNYTSYIDAKSGKKITDLYSRETVNPTDIKGHYAEKEISELIRNNVLILENDKFNPDEVLDQKNALSMLGTLIGFNSYRGIDIEALYRSSIVSRNILTADEKNPDEKVTREKAVKYILHSINYSNIQHIDDNVFASGFNDSSAISAEYNKYVSAAKGLGIVHGDENGNFNPQEQVTKAQFAIMIYNALTKIK